MKLFTRLTAIIVPVIFLLLVCHSTDLRAQGMEWRWKGPWGGVVTAIGRVENALVAATDGGGVFRSDDGGLSWNWSSNNYSQAHIDRFIAHGSTVIGLNSAAYRSSDAGITWQSMDSQGFSRSMAFVGETLISITPSGDVYA
ncbi:MAG: hypothetical protein ABI876_18595, partial [Bacteroidota bacterium]